MLDHNTKQELENAATRLRIMSIECTNATKSGHPTSCASSAEIVSCLFYKVMRYDPQHPRNPNNDRFVLSKGHAAPILYAAWTDVGFLKPEQLKTVRNISSDLEGHPTPRLEFVDVATGSLGQGLSCAAGMAYVGKYVDSSPSNHPIVPGSGDVPKEPAFRVYCLMGDGETAEGAVWEAMAFASRYQLDNLCAIIDVNRLGQSEPTMLQHDTNVYRARAEAFGFATYVVDGHNVEELMRAFDSMTNNRDGRPTCIVARTYKGHDMPGIEDKEGWHGKALLAGGAELSDKVLHHLREKLKAVGASVEPASGKLKPQLPPQGSSLIDQTRWIGGECRMKLSEPPTYKKGDSVATRQAYGNGLLKLAQSNPRVLSLDGDVKNSTFSEKVAKQLPPQFIECFIAEQNMVGVAVGAATRGRTVPFVSSFACFLTRAFDQIRMAAISQSHCNFSGSHAGVSIGEDGPSQMGLEDLAMFRSVPDSVVFYPSDAVSTERAVELAANQPSICYIRTGRPNTPIIYENEERFEIGKAKVVRHSDNDFVTIVACGVTLLEAMKAADQLAKEDIHVRIIDPFTVKPMDKKTLAEAAKATKGRVITIEDHHPEGGLGEAVVSALVEAHVQNLYVEIVGVHGVPRSGKPEELLVAHGLDAENIVKVVKRFK